MLMYHKKSKQPVDVHASQIETMINRGWSESPPTKPKPKPAKVETSATE